MVIRKIFVKFHADQVFYGSDGVRSISRLSLKPDPMQSFSALARFTPFYGKCSI